MSEGACELEYRSRLQCKLITPTNQNCQTNFNEKVVYILHSERKKSEILHEVTRPCVWLRLEICSVCVTFFKQPRPKWLNQAKFSKVKGAFAILHYYIEPWQFYVLFHCFPMEILSPQNVHHFLRPHLPLSLLVLPRRQCHRLDLIGAG